MLLEKIRGHYQISDTNGSIYIQEDDGGKRYLPKADQPIYLRFGHEVKDPSRVEELVAQGIVFKTTPIDIYREYFSWDEETECKEVNGYDLRTKEYFNQIQKDIGLYRFEDGYDEENLIDPTDLSQSGCSIMTTRFECGKIADGNYCVQEAIRTAIDDYTIMRYYFDHLPDTKQINIAKVMKNLKVKFFIRRCNIIFDCWECGRTVHWLDIYSDNFIEKANHLLDNYCGC